MKAFCALACGYLIAWLIGGTVDVIQARAEWQYQQIVKINKVQAYLRVHPKGGRR